METYVNIFKDMGEKAKIASMQLSLATTEQKNDALKAMKQHILQHSKRILDANQIDMDEADRNGVPLTMRDRLKLTEERILQIAEGIGQVVELPDPIGIIKETSTRPNGLHIQKITVPLGVVAIIYEARPNVTVDAATLCLKAGNAVILRGGKEAFHTNIVLVNILQEAAVSVGLDKHVVQLVEVVDREAVSVLLNQRQYIDVVIPRGGAGLINRIVNESRIPVIETGSGVCHTYIDKKCDLDLAVNVSINAKIQRPSTCNAMETLLIHKDVVSSFLPRFLDGCRPYKLEIRGDEFVRFFDKSIKEANESDWETEYNDFILSIKTVNSIEEAIEHINRYGTKHSEAIITTDEKAGAQFMAAVDASSVYVNASTRFTDGFEFGFGAEIGISTQKLHARGPMGLTALTSYKYLVQGTGQLRK